MNAPKVSICVLTYNHGSFIKQCLEGILGQKTTFDYEVLIHDDASTDDTANIIRSFESENKGILKPIYQTQNQHSKGVKPTLKYNFPRIKGKYVALCEGDDYWTDPYKLQKQVDLIEGKPNCNLVYSNRFILKSDNNLIDDPHYKLKLPEYFDLHYLLKVNVMPGTQTILFKKSAFPNPLPEVFFTAFNGDWVLLFLITQYGLIGYSPDKTAVYREGVGIQTTTNKLSQFINGLNTNKQLNQITNYAFDYHIGNFLHHYKNITYSLIESKQFIKGFLWYLKTVFYWIFNKRNKVNYGEIAIFTKHSFKLFFGKA